MKRICAEQQVEGDEFRYSGVFARPERGDVDRSGPLSTRPAAEGPCRSFEDVYARYKDAAWAYIRRAGVREGDAMDVFQASFLDMHEWVSQRSVPPEPAPILFRILSCKIANHLRGQRRLARRTDGAAETDTVPSGEPGADELLGEEDLYLMAEVISLELPPDVGLVFRMSHLYEMSAEQIAQCLGRREGTVRVQIHRARAAFAELVASYYWTVR